MSSQQPITLPEVSQQLQAGGSMPAELLEIFSEEAEDHLRTIYDGLNRVREKNDDMAALADVRRSAHTLKGAAGAVGLEAVTRLSHRMEDLLDCLAERKLGATPEQLKLFLATTDQIQDLTGGQIDVEAVAPQMVEIYATYANELNALGVQATPAQAAAPAPAAKSSAAAPAVCKTPHAAAPARKNNQFLRVPLHRLDDLVAVVGEMIVNRSGMTQKLGDLESRIDEIYTALDRLQNASRELEKRYNADSIRVINRVAGACSQMNRFGTMAASPTDTTTASPVHKLDSLEFDQYTEFHLLAQSLEEGNGDVAVVGEELRNLKSEFDNLFRRQGQLNREAQNSLMHIRMVPVSGIVGKLERTVRSVSGKLQRPVELQVVGESTELDKTVLDEIADPLLHVVRNAIDHGIESPRERKKAGKPEQAGILLEAINQGTQVTLRISDDGRGINLDKVREKAIKNELIEKEDELTREELLSLIFLPGFSTAAQLTDVSGRGVGMDVVRDAVSRLNGSIRVESEEGSGTTFTIQLPTSVGVTRALAVQSAGSTWTIPMQAVKQIQKLDPQSVEMQDEQPVVNVQGRTLPIKELASHLQLVPASHEPSFDVPLPLLVISVGDDEVAMTVDMIEGGHDIVVKSLGDHLRKVPGYVGATVRSDGSIVPILDPVDLVGKGAPIQASGHLDELPAAPVRVSTAMVIDDSISVRRVTTKLLQRAGWDVVSAKDGVDALEKLDELESAPDVFLCDMEMPRMNGIELIKRIRKQPEFAVTPIVMVTSRASEKHRHMAVEAGATDYVVKPFNDEYLLELIDELVQAARETVVW
ncbi:MAG: hybrid sensor histidine kinase/response regulator [Pirellulaceae bacterium]